MYNITLKYTTQISHKEASTKANNFNGNRGKYFSLEKEN